MMHGRSGRLRRLLALLGGGLVVAVAAGSLRGDTMSSTARAASAEPPFPLGEQLTYHVEYLGLHCGSLTLTSYGDDDAEDPRYHIVAIARTSKFFDGVYRVRVRLESVYSGRRMSSVSYHHTGEEKRDTKDELWLVDFDRREVRRTRDDEVKTIAIENDQVYDPLAYLFRMRTLLSDEVQQATLAMVTSDGDVDTVAVVVDRRRIKTPLGKREALIVVPRPKDDELFDKKGRLELWVGTDERRLPYRVVFDLPFGKLVAKLEKIEERAVTD
jgi:hypothetical protein